MLITLNLLIPQGNIIRSSNNKPNPQAPISMINNNVIGVVEEEEQQREITDLEYSDVENMNEDKKKEYQTYKDKIKLAFDLLNIEQPQLDYLDT